MLGPPAPLPFDPQVLRRYSALRQQGVDPQRDGAWTRVRRGVWVESTSWSGLTPEQQHAARAQAVSLVCDSDDSWVFAHETAAAVWGLPRIEAWPDAVRTLVVGSRLRGSSGVRPVCGADVDAVVVNGIRVTPVARTVVDLARSASLPTAVAAADHALRHGLCTRDDLVREADAVPARLRGRPQVSVVVDLADANSMSAGESLSRVQMFRLGLPRPRLQVRHEDEHGLIGHVDFDWEGVVGEFDGKVKYRVPADADPRDAAEIVWREKKREDRLRVGSQVARWTWEVALDRDRLGAVLAAKGIRADPRVSWFADSTRGVAG
jgi:hypothetical protein